MSRCRDFILLILVALLLLTPYIVTPVETQGTFVKIYIRGSGAIETDPPGVDVNIRRVGDLYYLTGDILGKIIIEKDNIVLDGRGYRIYGYHYGSMETAIQLSNRFNVTIENFKIEAFEEAISISNSSNVKIKSNLMIGTDQGVSIYNSVNISFMDNIISDSVFWGIMISNSTFVDVSFNLFMETYQAIKVYSSRNLLITYNSIYCSNCFSGLYLYAIRYSTIAHNVVKGRFGIFLLLSDNNAIYNNLFDNQESNYYVNAGINDWNTQPVQGVNILGGNFIGGNAYLLSGNNGYSQTCSDENKDGFCDQPLVLNNWNIDYYPLKYSSFMNPSNSTFYIYTTTVIKTITTTYTTTQTVTNPVTLTTTVVTSAPPETITTTRIETITHSTVATTTVPTTLVTTQINPVTKTSIQVLTEVSTTTHIYTTTPIEQIVSSIVSTLIALILAVAAIAILSVLTPEKKR